MDMKDQPTPEALQSEITELKKQLETSQSQVTKLETEKNDSNKRSAMLTAMKDIPFHSPEDIVELTWDQVAFDPSTQQLSAAGFSSASDLYKERAKRNPYEVASRTVSRRPTPKRSSMTLEERNDYIKRYGEEVYSSLPL